MSDIEITRLQDVPYSAQSCTFTLAGAPFEGILDLNYSQKRERKLVHAARRDGKPIGITSGKYSVDALSMKLIASSYQRLIGILTALGLGSYGDARFPITATYSDTAVLLAGGTPIVIAVEGARISGEKGGRTEGIDEATVEVEMMALSLTRNGARLWTMGGGL
jgi:hypothetical protein